MFSANQPDGQTMKYHLVQKTELTVFDIPMPKSGSDQIPLSYALKSYFQIRVI